MKKHIALFLVGIMLSMTACSSSENSETAEEAPDVANTVTETEAPAETEPETKYERPEDEPIIEYTELTLERDVVYDRSAGLFVLYFTNHEIWYEADSKCSIGLISDEEAFSVSGKPDFTAYPDIIAGEDYCGVAIKLDEEIPAGEYFVSITFDGYIVNFDYTAE